MVLHDNFKPLIDPYHRYDRYIVQNEIICICFHKFYLLIADLVTTPQTSPRNMVQIQNISSDFVLISI